jgi:hypothetical protein
LLPAAADTSAAANGDNDIFMISPFSSIIHESPGAVDAIIPPCGAAIKHLAKSRDSRMKSSVSKC